MCLTNRANISMKRKSKNSREIIDLMELSNDMTKLRREDQYLVTLKIRKSRRARRTDKPNEPAWATMFVQQTSKTLAKMTIQSKRLKEDSK